MKKKLFLSLFSFLFIFSGSFSYTAKAGANEVKAPETLYEEETKNLDDYYGDLEMDGTSKGDLLNLLAKQMNENHRYFTSYEDVKGANAYSDEDPDDETKILSFYAGVSIPNDWNSGSLWNREHVWCKSLSNGLYTSVSATGRGAGADIHQLKPAIKSMNESRGNKPYADLNKQGTQKEYDGKKTGCYYNENYFEPRDDIKGDISRILMYMYTHYSTEVEENTSRSSVSNTKTTAQAGNMKIEDILVTEEKTAASTWKTLLKWNELDPVDALEAKRNDYCASITGVRNPFIDHPEFATMIWDETYEGAGAFLDEDYIQDENTPLKKMEFYHKDIQMKEGEKRKLNIAFTPYYAYKNQEVTYTSSDASVAEFINNELVAKKKGTAVIEAKVDHLSTTCYVVVDEQKEEAVYVIDTKTSVKESGTLIEGSYATYEQSHQTKGQMTANHYTLLSLYGYQGYKIKGITLNMKSNGKAGSGGLSVMVNEHEIASIQENTAFNSPSWAGKYTTAFVDVPIQMKDTDYVIQDEEVLTIRITASVNSLYISSYAIDYEKEKEVVDILPTSITLNKTEVSLFVGETFQIEAIVLPEDALNKEITFTSLNSEVASVSEKGLVEAKKKGSTSILVKTIEGDVSATITIDVKEKEEDKPIETKKGCAKTSTWIFSIFALFICFGAIAFKSKF